MATDPNSFASADPVIGFDFSAVYDSLRDAPAQILPGTKIRTQGGFMHFAQVNEAAGIAIGRFAIIGPDGQAIAMNTTDSGSLGQDIGVACAALADNEYGWFWRGPGTWEALVTDSVAANTQLTTTASDGIAGTGGDTIQGLRNLELGVTATLVDVFAAVEMTTNV